MKVILKHCIYPIKNGFAANSPEVRLTAHGSTPELARRNLETITTLFLRSFERSGVLDEEVRLMRLTAVPNGQELIVTTVG